MRYHRIAKAIREKNSRASSFQSVLLVSAGIVTIIVIVSAFLLSLSN